MDTFQHSYYIINRRLLLLIGQWPFESSINGFCYMLFIATLLLSFIAPQILLFITNGKFNTMLEITPSLIAVLSISSKLFSLYYYRNNLRHLLEGILDSWKIWKTKEEVDIMHKFGKEGRMLTVFYAIQIYSAMTMFLLLPFVPRVMDSIIPLNESRHLTPIFKSEYFIDEDEYFLSIYFHMAIAIVIGITVLVANDVLFLVLSSHICGLFAVTGTHLENFLNGQIQSHRSCLLNSIIYAIKSHKRALEFAKYMKFTYSIPLFLQVSLSLICLAVSLFQILITMGKPSEAVRYGAFALAQLVHLFCLCYPGQRMIDYSTQMQFKAYGSLWYETPLEIRRLVLFIMKRSLTPCCLTAGKIILLCSETYLAIIQTSISYFMVIAEVQ